MVTASSVSDTRFITNEQITSGKLPVMEMFYTLQGEGFHTGSAAYFIRLAGCDVGCVWCDVKESWEVSELQYLPVETIVKNATGSGCHLAVITGGEPCMYDLSELISALHSSGFEVNIETSGAYPLSGKPDWVCVSPKKFKAPLREVLQSAHELKVVIFNTSDFEWAEQNASHVNPDCKLFLQPEFGKSTKLMPAIVDYVKLNPRWRISLQTHKYIGIP